MGAPDPVQPRPRQPLVAPALAFLVGIAGGWFLPDQSWQLPALFAGAALAVFLVTRRLPALRHAAFLGVIAGAGACHLHLCARSFDPASLERITAESPRWCELTGTVLEHLDSATGARPAFILEAATLDRSRATGRVRVRLHDGTLPPAGSVIRVHGRLFAPTRALNPGQFDPRSHWARHRVHRQLDADPGPVDLVAAASPAWTARVARACREYMRRALREGIGDDPATADVITGMMLGDTTRFSDEQMEEFRRTGTLHVFAVSGQNIATLAAVVLALAPSFGVRRWRWGWLLIPGLGVYVLATGADASALRAWLMASLVLAAWWLDRPILPGQLLAAALFLLLLADPLQAFDTGFQLSFAVVLALVCFTPFLHRRMEGFGAPDPMLPAKLRPGWMRAGHRVRRFALGAAAATLAAAVGSAPLTWWHFHLASLSSPLVNLAVVPLASLVTAIGSLAVSLHWAVPGLASLCNHASWLAARMLLACIHAGALLPNAAHHVARPTDVWIAHEPRITVFSVGSGQCALVQSAGSAELLDTASRFEARTAVQPALKALGINSIDRLWISQGDSGHAGGVPTLAAAWPVRAWGRPATPHGTPSARAAAAALPGDPFEVVAPVSVDARGWTWHFLHPGPAVAREPVDTRALAACVEWPGGARVLFAGDPPASVQHALATRASPPRADVLVLGRSSTHDPIDPAFLDAVRPAHLLFHSGGYREETLRPSEIESCRARGIRVWLLDRTGAVTIRRVGGTLALRGFVDDAAP
jgi:ComEC/Rec2-related protein